MRIRELHPKRHRDRADKAERSDQNPDVQQHQANVGCAKRHRRKEHDTAPPAPAPSRPHRADNRTRAPPAETSASDAAGMLCASLSRYSRRCGLLFGLRHTSIIRPPKRLIQQKVGEAFVIIQLCASSKQSFRHASFFSPSATRTTALSLGRSRNFSRSARGRSAFPSSALANARFS